MRTRGGPCRRPGVTSCPAPAPPSRFGADLLSGAGPPGPRQRDLRLSGREHGQRHLDSRSGIGGIAVGPDLTGIFGCNGRTATITLAERPAVRRAETASRIPIIVVVSNALIPTISVVVPHGIHELLR